MVARTVKLPATKLGDITNTKDVAFDAFRLVEVNPFGGKRLKSAGWDCSSGSGSNGSSDDSSGESSSESSADSGYIDFLAFILAPTLPPNSKAGLATPIPKRIVVHATAGPAKAAPLKTGPAKAAVGAKATPTSVTFSPEEATPIAVLASARKGERQVTTSGATTTLATTAFTSDSDESSSCFSELSSEGSSEDEAAVTSYPMLTAVSLARGRLSSDYSIEAFEELLDTEPIAVNPNWTSGNPSPRLKESDQPARAPPGPSTSPTEATRTRGGVRLALDSGGLKLH